MLSGEIALKNNHYNYSQLFRNLFSLSTQGTYIPCPNLHPKAPLIPAIILQAILACSRMKRGIFLFKVGRCHTSQPSDQLAPTIISCFEDLWSEMFYRKHAFATVN